VDEIYKHADRLRATTQRYLEQESTKKGRVTPPTQGT
jgi:hypothetical protein